MSPIAVEQVPVAATRALRREILRPHETQEEIAAHEPAGAIAVGAFLDGRLVGVGLAGPEGDDGAWRVRGMAVRPEARGRGAGTAILRALLREAATHGAPRVWATVRTPARSLYLRAGFRETSEEYELPHVGPHVVMETEVG